jgi:branched-chain amino acid transport system substrate-binding protein
LSGEIPVGFAFALTGPASIYGTSQQNAVNLAVDEINSSGMLGGATLKPVIQDDAGKPETATTVFEQLINEDDVVAIIGPTLSNAAKSSDPIAQEAGVPVVAVSNTAAGITEIGDYIFRASLPESAVIPNTVKVAKDKLGFSKVALMYANDDAFSKSGYDVFKRALQDNGVEIVAEETFSTNDTDFSPQLTKIKGLNPDALVVSALAQPAAGILRQAKQLGLNVPIIGGNGFNSPDLTKLAGEAANDAISGAAWFVANDNARNKAFVEAYKAKYGKEPDQFAAQAYAGTYLLAQAIKNAGSTDRTAVRDALDQLKDVDTVLGTFSFNNREPQHPPVVQQLENGAFKLFE